MLVGLSHTPGLVLVVGVAQERLVAMDQETMEAMAAQELQAILLSLVLMFSMRLVVVVEQTPLEELAVQA